MSALKKILVMVVLTVVVFSAGFLSGCRTVPALCRDIAHGSTIIADTLAPVEKKVEQDRIERAAQLVLENKRSIENSK